MKKRKKQKKAKIIEKEDKLKDENNLLTGGLIGVIVGLLLIRGLFDYIRDNNLPYSYIIAIYIVVAIIALIAAIRLGKKSRKMKNSLFLCIAIISFISLYYIGSIIRSSYPQYNHIYKIPIAIGMIISFVIGTLLLFSFSNNQ